MTLTVVPDTPDGLTPSAARIYAALHAAPGDTVAELADAARTGKSTTANLLKRMEQDGLVQRTLGGSDGNRRYPDHWYLASTSESDDTDAPRPGGESPDSTATDNEASAPSAAARGDEPSGAGDQSHDPADETDLAEAPVSEPQAVPNASSDEAPPNGRLGQGGLRTLVRAYLAKHPDSAHSPTKISRQLGRSSGAVANALVTLVNLKQAEMVTAKPRTYRIVTSPTQPS